MASTPAFESFSITAGAIEGGKRTSEREMTYSTRARIFERFGSALKRTIARRSVTREFGSNSAAQRRAISRMRASRAAGSGTVAARISLEP